MSSKTKQMCNFEWFSRVLQLWNLEVFLHKWPHKILIMLENQV